MELRSTTGNGVENIFRSNKALDFVTGTGAYSNVFRVGETEGSTFFHTLNFRASDASNKTVTIDAISGIGTFNGIVVNGATSTISNLNVTGIITATGADINGDLDVDGHTNLDNVSVAGVTTFSTSPIATNGTYYKGIINSGSQAKIVGGYISGSDTLRLGESMYLTSTGLGIGTATPAFNLHIYTSGYAGQVFQSQRTDYYDNIGLSLIHISEPTRPY